MTLGVASLALPFGALIAGIAFGFLLSVGRS